MTYLSKGERLKAVLKDVSFYGADGGVTFSGGEPLLQPEFVIECANLCRRLCREKNISVAVDTCGFVPRETIDAVLPYTDYFLYDIKAATNEIHVLGTGRSNVDILDNYRYISNLGKNIYVRIPVIGSFNGNDDEITRIAEFLSCAPSPFSYF